VADLLGLPCTTTWAPTAYAKKEGLQKSRVFSLELATLVQLCASSHVVRPVGRDSCIAASSPR